MYRVSPLSTRNEFGRLLNERGLTGEAVEIGTHRGESTQVLLSSWTGRKVWCVDPWKALPGYQEQEKLLEGWGGDGDRDRDFVLAQGRLKRWIDEGRCELLRMTSAEALTLKRPYRFEDGDKALRTVFLDGLLDFVYVDGDHRFAEVLRDLTGWWPKLRSGGILAGHDWAQPGETHRWAEEVQMAVTEFSQGIVDRQWFDGAGNGILDVHLVVEENGLPWSYWMEKP